MTSICISRSNLMIPATMATQHPDNANPPYWHACPPERHDCGYVSAADEAEECYRSFADLDCQEYMWDWEGKFVDEEVIERLFNDYSDYFTQHQLGRDKFLTFRVPNIWHEETSRLPRAFMTMLTANATAQRLGLSAPPIFEGILPQTDDAPKLIYMQEKFRQTSELYCKIYEKPCNMHYFSIIPLIETTRELLRSKELLAEYLQDFERTFGCTVDYLRPFIARSDPALQAGFIPATLAAKVAASEYSDFAHQRGIKVYPLMGVGALHFRGGLNPRSITSFLETYPGIRTLTLQSAFRYDYPLHEVVEAVRNLNLLLPKQQPDSEALELETVQELDTLFRDIYVNTFADLADFVIAVASLIPERRERITFSGKHGYGRKIGTVKVTFPRAITFTAAFYSLGIPPEFIATGRGIQKLRDDGRLQTLEKAYPHLKQHLVEAGNYLSKGNLRKLADKFRGFGFIKRDVALLEDYIGGQLGPTDEAGFSHRERTEQILGLVLAGENADAQILEAAKLRRSLG